MSIRSRFSNLLRYIASIRNPRLFLYRTFHYLNSDVPLERARRICGKNRADYAREGIGDLIIDTYDGSGQLVHPDMICFGAERWFVATPYPYGMEEYENPCIYRCTSAYEFVPHTCPISFQERHKQGTHLSDPVFLTTGSELYCIYRSTERREVSHLLYSRYDRVNDKWEKPECFCSGTDDLLSPAFVYDGSIIMFHADWTSGKGRLTRSVLGRDFKLESSKEVSVSGLPQGYMVWHQAVSTCSADTSADELKGLFLLKKSRRSVECRLFRAVSHDNGLTWNVTDEVTWPDSKAGKMKYPYKSCFIPGEDGIILSFVDMSGRYRLIRLG